MAVPIFLRLTSEDTSKSYEETCQSYNWLVFNVITTERVDLKTSAVIKFTVADCHAGKDL